MRWAAANFSKAEFPDLRPQRPRLRHGKWRCTPTARSISRRCATPPARWAIRTGCCRPPRSLWTPSSSRAPRAAWSCASRMCRSSTRRISRFRSATSARAACCSRASGIPAATAIELEVPYYFNLAPNYDLTLTPGYLSARGVQLAGEFRYLTASSHGQIEENFLPNDTIDAQRPRLRALHRHHRSDARDCASIPTSPASATAATSRTSAVGTDQTSVTFLERRADLLYYDDAWRVRAQLQNFQTIDTSVDAGDRPYSRVPRVEAFGAVADPRQQIRVSR